MLGTAELAEASADPKPTVYGIRNGQFVPFDENGYFIDRTPHVPVSAKVPAAAGGAASSESGFDWFGMVETTAGALLVGDSASGDDGAPDDDLAGGAGEDSSPLGDARPFEFGPDAVSGDIEELADNDRGSTYACDIISAECKGSVLREFPGQYLNSTLDDIQSDAQDGVKDARKALKLLNDGRFKK